MYESPVEVGIDNDVEYAVVGVGPGLRHVLSRGRVWGDLEWDNLVCGRGSTIVMLVIVKSAEYIVIGGCSETNRRWLEAGIRG